jgi:hypothetical protein
LPFSSSLIRALVAAGEPIEELVGCEVARYIAEHRLYRDTEPRSAEALESGAGPASRMGAQERKDAQERNG